MNTRFGLISPAQFAQEIRKSRFVANAANVASPQAALDFVARVSDATASHNCWAWRIGQNYRFNDDGEPSGTAGKPILLAIDGQAMDEIAVVVTRWFGGIKLGAGGLMRAYGGCAAECLRQAEKTERIDLAVVEISVEFALLPLLRSRLGLLDATVVAEHFCATGADLRVSIAQANLQDLQRVLSDLSRGQSKLRRVDGQQ
ncbi:MAG TPA: YigZ family protein [Rudaea sp.]|nr:YigZ family protein [Rudaea sp.]